MSGRIGRAFDTARRERRGAFVPFLTSGFPDLAESDRLALAVCEEGADVLELGVPFSDPLADGPTIQRTTRIALEQGTTLEHVLGQALRLRSRVETPLILMTYLNPIVRYGEARFAADAREVGVDGLILVDLPPEEEPALWEEFQAAGLDTIALVAPTTDPRRLPGIAARARGFLYVVARLGVTDLDRDGSSGLYGLPVLVRPLILNAPLAPRIGSSFRFRSILSLIGQECSLATRIAIEAKALTSGFLQPRRRMRWLRWCLNSIFD
jgi:tryptophan synthase alpha subunit